MQISPNTLNRILDVLSKSDDPDKLDLIEQIKREVEDECQPEEFV